MNKLRPGSISRIDPREDGKLRTSNVTKFLASCSANGLPPEDLFLRDDLIEGTSDCLARVAKTIIALVKWAETPVPTQSHILRGGKGGSKLKPINVTLANAAAPGSPYRTGSSSSRAIMSSPNLSVSPSHPPPQSPTSKHPLPPGLSTLRSHSPDTASSSDAVGTETEGRQTPTGTSDRDEVPPIVAPPPRSPLRSMMNDSARMSIADSTTGQSIASSNMTETSTYSSLLDGGRIGSASGPYYGKFGTIRTVTTEATSFIPSEWPSMTRTEGSAMAASMLGCDDGPGDITASIYGNNSPNGHVGGRRRSLEGPTVRPRERKPSETVPVDLLRVVEESEELAGGVASDDRTGRMERINLGKGKWPDDFLDALKASSASASASRPIAIRKRSGDLGISASTSVNSSAGAASSPPRGSVDSLSLSSSFPSTGPLAAAAAAAAARRPTHRARHSVDAPVVLVPKDTCTMLRRDSSPDPSSLGLGPSPGRVALRRNSTRNGRSGTYVPRRSSPEDGGSGGDNSDSQQQQLAVPIPIPFPRAVSGESPSPFSTPSQSQSSPQFEHAGGPFSITSSASASASSPSLIPRGRFQSEVDGSSSRRRPRPDSYDEFGAKPRRSRFESMVNLGVASGEQASASDLMARDATEGSMSRQTLVVREEGKAPTHFVSGSAI